MWSLRALFAYRPTAKLARRRRLSFERLEDRWQPSVTFGDPLYDPYSTPPTDDPTVPAQSPTAPEAEAVAAGPMPLRLLGKGFGVEPEVSWPITATYTGINMGSLYFAIQFDRSVDPATIVPGVNLQLQSREDDWWDAWSDVSFEWEYDDASKTLTLRRPVNEYGRPPFNGAFYRLYLGGDETNATPMRGPDGLPLGFDDQHLEGRNYELRFLFDDGTGGSKADVSAGPAPEPSFILIEIAPTPILIGPVPSSGSPPTTEIGAIGGGAAAAATAPSVATVASTATATPTRLVLESVDLSSGTATTNNAPPIGSPRGSTPNLAAALSVAPVGGVRVVSASSESSADRLDLGGVGDDGTTASEFMGILSEAIFGWLNEVVPDQTPR